MIEVLLPDFFFPNSIENACKHNTFPPCSEFILNYLPIKGILL